MSHRQSFSLGSWWCVALFAILGLFLLGAAFPSSECGDHDHCVGEQSYCVNYSCDCGHKLLGYRCGDPVNWYSSYYYAGYQHYRGYGNGYSAAVLVSMIFVGGFALLWYFATSSDAEAHQNRHQARSSSSSSSSTLVFKTKTPSVQEYRRYQV